MYEEFMKRVYKGKLERWYDTPDGEWIMDKEEINMSKLFYDFLDKNIKITVETIDDGEE
jgi:hypothetical protein